MFTVPDNILRDTELAAGTRAGAEISTVTWCTTPHPGTLLPVTGLESDMTSEEDLMIIIMRGKTSVPGTTTED